MGHADAWQAAEDRFEQRDALAAVTIDEGDSSWETADDEIDTPWETFDEEINTWARRALAANGFGDY
jgi:hypothetical protein